MKIAWVFVVACASPTAAPPPCATDLGPELARLNVPGLAAGIVKDGEVQCTAAAGMADIAANRPVTADTLFLLASTSKTVTATALMTQSDKFGLDDDVNAKLPFHVAIPACPTAPITYRQLLTHSSSIDDSSIINCPVDCQYGDGFSATVTRGGDSPIPLHDFVASYLVPGGGFYDDQANFLAGCPGTISSYSNMGVTLAGYAAEVIAGEPLEQLTRDRIFTPLGMRETAWRIADIDPAHLAMPYNQVNGSWVPYGQFGEPDWPDGDLRSSVTELSRFLLMFMGEGELDGVRVLPADVAREMRRVQDPNLDDTQGLIWFYDDYNGRRVLGHDGSDNGTSTYMYFDPMTNAGVILLANGVWEDAAGNTPAADDLLSRLFAESDTW